MRPCEVAVVGAGIVGVAVADELQARGVDVALLDRGEVAGATTGLGEGNVLASDKDAGPELGLTVAGLAVYDELEARLGARARIRRKGALIVHPDATTWEGEAQRVARARLQGAPGELLDAARVRELEPALTGPLLGASWFPGDLQVDPAAITRALAEGLPRVHPGVAVEAIEVRGGRVVALRTRKGRISCSAVVIAAGAWSRSLAGAVGARLPLEPRKGQLVRLRTLAGVSPPIRHKVVDGRYLASVTSAAPGLQVTTVFESTFEGDVLVGSSRERRGFDVSVDEAVSEAMIARAARLAPVLAELPRAAAWAGLRPWLPDHLPAIGPSAAAAGLWLATGHEGAGVALGPVTGRLVAQLYTGATPVVDPTPFSPDRFAG